jgi:hypothetical protein
VTPVVSTATAVAIPFLSVSVDDFSVHLADRIVTY